MGLQTKTIKQKIRSVKNIGKITKTMEMVSVAKMKKVALRAQLGRSYSQYALELLHQIAIDENVSHPLLNKKDTDKALVLVISSHKGLAGSYNTNIARALGVYKNKVGKQVDCIAIGKQSEKAARLHQIPVIATFNEVSEKSISEDFLTLRDKIIQEFKDGAYQSISILFTKFISTTNYKPFMMQLLPVEENIFKDTLLSGGEDKEKIDVTLKTLYTFEPSVPLVLDVVIYELLNQAIYYAFLESLASEHSSRMFAMKNANDNAEEILGDLTLYYNQVRQGAITQELSEIVGGAVAME